MELSNFVGLFLEGFWFIEAVSLSRVKGDEMLIEGKLM